MKKRILIVLVFVSCLSVGYLIGWTHRSLIRTDLLDKTVAMQWGDSKYGNAFYGAHVFLEPINTGYSVHARVYIGRGNGMFHDCGKLGTVKTDAEAVEKWGKIQWRTEGLYIGNGTNQGFLLPRAQLESHR